MKMGQILRVMVGLWGFAMASLVCAQEGQSYVDSFVYKYVDSEGGVHFTDSPVSTSGYRLEWKRESRRLVNEQKERSARLSATTSGPAKNGGTPPRRQSSSTALSGSIAERRARYAALVDENARRYGVPNWLVHAVIRVESAYNPSAVSRAGAGGLMQLMPGTAARYGVKDRFDPAENVRGGTAYLRDLLDLFDWDLKLALAGYNAGEGAVLKHGRQIPPYAETQGYVKKIVENLRAERAAGSGVALSVR